MYPHISINITPVIPRSIQTNRNIFIFLYCFWINDAATSNCSSDNKETNLLTLKYSKIATKPENIDIKLKAIPTKLYHSIILYAPVIFLRPKCGNANA